MAAASRMATSIRTISCRRCSPAAAAGSSRPGRHIIYQRETPVTNLFMTMLERMGVRREQVGDSTGAVDRPVAARMSQDPKGPVGPPPIGVVYNTSMARPTRRLALAALHVSASRRESRDGRGLRHRRRARRSHLLRHRRHASTRRSGPRCRAATAAADRPCRGVAAAARSPDGGGGGATGSRRTASRSTCAPFKR